MRFKKDPSGWNQLTRSREGLVGRHIQRLVDRLILLAKRQVGVDTGELRSSIKGNVTATNAGIIGMVGSENPIAYMHHQGTRAHIIQPVRSQTLRFSMRGKIVYTKLVRHPGTKPNRYLTDPLRTVIED